MSAFGNGSNSSGQFWFGQYGFLYKKNVGVGGRRSTKMAPGGNITCNSTTNLFNKYKPGGGGVGASSISNRRAKNRLATICNPNNNCFPCFTTLGRYNSYTGNPNGFIPCPPKLSGYKVSGTFIESSNSQYNKIITFTGNGTFIAYSSYLISYVVVGGAGGGGSGYFGSNGGGGGGGGGGVIESSSLFDGFYTITVGTGGNGASYLTPGQPGTNGTISSIIGSTSIIVANGGEGATTNGGKSGTNGSTGGSGNGTPVGGDGTIGGGGGAGGFTYSGGNGSLNISTIYGTIFGAGGGGGSGGIFGSGGSAGNSNAGQGVQINTLTNAGNGAVNTGGGGGGGSKGNFGDSFVGGGNGGSGVVILLFNIY